MIHMDHMSVTCQKIKKLGNEVDLCNTRLLVLNIDEKDRKMFKKIGFYSILFRVQMYKYAALILNQMTMKVFFFFRGAEL